MITEVVHLDRDNTIDLQLKADGVVVDLSGTTKMELAVGSTTISSTTSPSAFDWSNHGSGTPAADRKLILSLGDESLTVGKYWATLFVYDLLNTDGIAWDTFRLQVK